MSLQISQSFASSIKNFESYPENLIHRATYLSVSRAYRTRLDGIEKKLFATKAADVNVPFRDLKDSGLGPFAVGMEWMPC